MGRRSFCRRSVFPHDTKNGDKKKEMTIAGKGPVPEAV